MSRKSKKSKGAIMLLSATLLLGAGITVGIGSNGFQNWDVKTWFGNKSADDIGNIDASITAHGMTVKRLATVENQDGSVSYIYSYSLTPSNPSRKEMTIALAWNGQTEAVIGNFLEATVDSSAQTFTITKKADFSTQAKATIQSVSNEDVNAEILIDCKQTFLGFNQNTTGNYVRALTSNDNVGIASIKSALAEQAGANSLSQAYTIALEGNYSIANLAFTATGYLTGNSTDAMSDAGITLDSTFAFKTADLSGDIGLANLQGYIDSDYAKFGENKVQQFEGNAYFGIAYTMTGTLSRAGQSTTITANIKAVAATSLLSFGSVPSSIDPETSHVVFNDDSQDSSQSSQGQEEVAYTYFLERSNDSDSASQVLQTLEMTEYGDSGWFVSTEYNIEYGQAFRVRIHGSDGNDTYSSDEFAWGNTNGGGYFAFSPDGENWDNATQNLGGGLYYVQL